MLHAQGVESNAACLVGAMVLSTSGTRVIDLAGVAGGTRPIVREQETGTLQLTAAERAKRVIRRRHGPGRDDQHVDFL